MYNLYKETNRQRDKKTKRQRDKETKRQRYFGQYFGRMLDIDFSKLNKDDFLIEYCKIFSNKL